VDLRHEHGGLVGVGAACAKVEGIESVGRDFGEAGGQFYVRFVGVKRGGVQQLVDLLFDACVDGWVVVSNAGSEDTGKEVEVLVAVAIPLHAFATRQRKRGFVVKDVVGPKVLALLVENFGCIQLPTTHS